MHQNSIAQNLEGMTGYLAWAIVCYLTLSTQPTETLDGQLRLLSIVIGLLLFIIGFYLTTRDQEYTRMDKRIRQVSIIVQLLSVILIHSITNSGVIAILGVALAAQLPIRFSRLVAYFGVMALIALDWYFNAIYWSVDDALVWTSLAGAFNLFAFRMSQRVMQEQEARDEITMLNRELIATQALLQESTKQSERLRISRDLHDGLGHHLTALILKLQYLTYTTSGDNQSLIKEAHDMAKQLLTDVRETVSEMRENSNIGLQDALEALIAQIPRLKILLTVDPALQLPDAKTADTLFRCVQEGITNTLKHGNASEMTIQLIQVEDNVELHIHDNGFCQIGFSEGNGLTGMRERIEHLRGQLIVTTKQGFGLTIRIPTMEAI